MTPFLLHCVTGEGMEWIPLRILWLLKHLRCYKVHHSSSLIPQSRRNTPCPHFAPFSEEYKQDVVDCPTQLIWVSLCRAGKMAV